MLALCSKHKLSAKNITHWQTGFALGSDAPQPFILAGRYSELRFKLSRKIKLIAKSEMIAYGAYRQISLRVLHKTATASRLSRMSDKEPKYALKPHF